MNSPKIIFNWYQRNQERNLQNQQKLQDTNYLN